MSGKNGSGLTVLSLGITVGFQTNMMTLPRLVPGDNMLYIKSETLDDAQLKAEWVYSDRQGQKVQTLLSTRPGENSCVVNPGFITRTI